jgi:hypothetical protein
MVESGTDDVEWERRRIGTDDQDRPIQAYEQFVEGARELRTEVGSSLRQANEIGRDLFERRVDAIRCKDDGALRAAEKPDPFNGVEQKTSR